MVTDNIITLNSRQILSSRCEGHKVNMHGEAHYTKTGNVK